MNVDLVLEGGGILGLAFIGAYQALLERGYRVNRIAGTSAGSLMASLIYAGYTPDELMELVKSVEFAHFAEKTRMAKIPLVGKPLSLWFNKGIHQMEELKSWLNELLEEKGHSMFNDNRLKIIASDVTSKRMMILPDCLPEYGREASHFPIADAVIMSSAIPYYFVPYQLNYDETTHFIIDGGLLSNFPVWIFDRKGTPRWPTFGLKIKDAISQTAQHQTNVINFTKDIIGTIIDKDETIYLSEGDRVRTILIDHNEKIKTTDFHLSDAEKQTLIDCGYESTVQFLKTFDFDWYCFKYRQPIENSDN